MKDKIEKILRNWQDNIYAPDYLAQKIMELFYTICPEDVQYVDKTKYQIAREVFKEYFSDNKAGWNEGFQFLDWLDQQEKI